MLSESLKAFFYIVFDYTKSILIAKPTCIRLYLSQFFGLE